MTGRIDSIVASAGTGKTYTLVERIASAVIAGLRPDRLLATTFTVKAAGELAGRVRSRLIELGRPDLAAAMLTARIGTVNSVCGNLISEFAFELGRSPVVDVIPEDQQTSVFERAIGPVMAAYAPRISPVAARFGMEAQGRAGFAGRVEGWQDQIRRIVDLARSNGIGSEDLGRSAEHSARTLLPLLPPPIGGETAVSLDAELVRAVQNCWTAANAVRATLKKGTVDKDLKSLEEVLPAIERGESLSWADWARLSKLGCTKADEHLFADVVAAASAHLRHPRLRNDVEQLIALQFECASACMDAFAEHKRAHGLLDFVDQEMLALDILRMPANLERLREGMGAVFVDEYQDSSPIQVAIFIALAQLVPGSLWVGDPKQSIYGFRGADPEMTLTAARAATLETGGSTEYLRTSWRSRPSLCDFVGSAFLRNFQRRGMSVDEITFGGSARREWADGPAALSAWTVQGRNKRERTELLARRVAGLLADPEGWPVQTRHSEERRPARGGDVAILCRSNAEVVEVAAAVARQGLRVAVDRPGLLDQPEVELALAALKWVADPADSIAAAELARLAGEEGVWLPAAFQNPQGPALESCIPFAAELSAVRGMAGSLTPAEVFDLVLHAPGLLVSLQPWGSSDDRLSNLEALRVLVHDYQDQQRSSRQAATLTGACAWIAELENPCQPASRHPDAVNVMTYHAAKGLEWPIVILTELNSKAKCDPFGVTAEAERELDWREPLAGRVLRYWPWPYGLQATGVGLDVIAGGSLQGQAAASREALERARLLYVGMTRARDHMCLALAGGTDWLDELQDGDDAPVLSVQPDSISVAGKALQVRPAPDAIEPRAVEERQEFGAVECRPTAHPPFRVQPSASGGSERVVIRETVTIGPRVVLVGDPDMQMVGEAMHRFLACDDPEMEPDRRTDVAARVLGRWAVPQLRPTDLVGAADRLNGFLTDRFDGCSHMREWPVHASLGLQVVSGRIDLLLDHPEGYIVLDHKSFPGLIQADQDRLLAFGRQVSSYGTAIAAVTGRQVHEYWIHQPIVGTVSRVQIM